MNDLDPTDETLRNPALAALTDRINAMIDRELDAYQATHGARPQHLLLLTQGLDMEVAQHATCYDDMLDAMTEIAANWVENGLVDLDEAPTPAPRQN